MTEKDGVFDMGSVSEEDPTVNDTTPVVKQTRAKRVKKEAGAVSDGEGVSDKEPAAEKVPVVGEYGKRGLPNYNVKLTDALFEGAAAKHHQREVIYGILAGAENQELPVGDIVLAIESSDELLAKMKTNQSIFKCVTYQVNELVKHGVVETDKPVRERKVKGSDETAATADEGTGAAGDEGETDAEQTSDQGQAEEATA